MRDAINFAPISGQPSFRRRLAGGYFTLTGVLSIAFILIGVGLALSGDADMQSALRAHPLRPMINTLLAIGFLVAGHYLSKGSRRAGIAGIFAFLIPGVAALVGVTVSTGSLVISLVGVAVIISIWDELA